MARIYPFPALRYNPAKVKVEDVVTQPYDKISPALQQKYYERSPFNLVRVILGLPEAGDDDQNNVYTRAAASLKQWRKEGVLLADHTPSIYAYSQTYAVPGEPGAVRERRGFIALGEVVPYEEGIVFRHEKTLSKPKNDRLNLLRATRAHFGQIFMLYSDPVHSAEKLLFAANVPPDVEVTDDYGVVHRVWRVEDAATLNMVTAAMADKKLIIADGHHRYETALNYSREHKPEGTADRDPRGMYQAPAYPEAALMMTFINMDSEGLTILPTHRVVHGLENFSAQDFVSNAAEFFTIEKLPADANAKAVLESGADGAGRFFVATAEGNWLLTSKPETLAAALPEYSDRQRKVDVTVLHGVILEKLLGLTQESIANQTNLSYVRDAAEAQQMVASGKAQVAFLMCAATLDQLRDVAFAGEVMPQKSTDFYPKLLSGLTIYALD